MQPGELDQRITIQTLTSAKDAAGGSVESWSTLATVWAKVIPQGASFRSRERDMADQRESPLEYVVTIRTRSDVTTAHRILWRGTLMNIRTMPDAGPRPMYLDLYCEAGVAV